MIVAVSVQLLSCAATRNTKRVRKFLWEFLERERMELEWKLRKCSHGYPVVVPVAFCAGCSTATFSVSVCCIAVSQSFEFDVFCMKGP